MQKYDLIQADCFRSESLQKEYLRLVKEGYDFYYDSAEYASQFLEEGEVLAIDFIKQWVGRKSEGIIVLPNGRGIMDETCKVVSA
jgi:hypothetical protein